MFNHGKQTYFALDDLAGALTAITGFAKSAKYGTRTDRPETQCFGNLGKKHQVTGLREATFGLSGYWQQTASVKLHGKTTKVLLDQYPLTGYLNKASVKRGIDLPETQCFGDLWKRRQVLGLMNGDISFSGFFDSTAGAADPVFRAALGIDPPGYSVVTIGANGFTIGNLVEMFQGVVPSYDINSDENNVVDLSASLMSDDQFDVGYSLHDLVAETTAGTTNYASVDGTTPTTQNGGVGHIHVSAFSGWTNAIVKIQDSADNAAFADVAGLTFSTITGVTKERLETAATATIRRYWRATVTFTGGAGSMTFQVSFSRRQFVSALAGSHAHFCGLLTFASTSTFEYGPEGNASGKRRFTGECRLSDYSNDFDENGVTAYSANLVSDSTVTENTFP